MGPIARMLSEDAVPRGIRLLYLTPLRALSRDLALAIREPIEVMGWPIRVGSAMATAAAVNAANNSNHHRRFLSRRRNP